MKEFNQTDSKVEQLTSEGPNSCSVRIKNFGFDAKIIYTLFQVHAHLIRGFNYLPLELAFADPKHEAKIESDQRVICDLSVQLLKLVKFINDYLEMYDEKNLIEVDTVFAGRIQEYLNKVQMKHPEKIPSQMFAVYLADMVNSQLYFCAKDFLKLHECPYSMQFASENTWPLRKFEFNLQV
ncbi:hypothetical protein Ciccas_004118 [Cichlidogyrus casuarinus]|uniref:Uncharacterized protein n=1 Tax=Cichlidogyrus casuarinus TaxID=1844966 RepID=A0ABD2QCF2_9PLAT